MRPVQPTMQPQQQGFTLIEIIVVFTLLGMIMVLVFSGIDSGRNAVQKGEKKITAINEIRVVHNLLRKQLSRMMPMGFGEDEEGQLVVFEGSEESVVYVSPMPGYLGNGGPHIQKVEIVSGNNGLELHFSHTLLSNNMDEQEELNFESEEPIILLENMQSARFSFIGLDEEGLPTEWENEWEQPSVLPLMVQLDIEMQRGHRERWPLFQVAMMLDGAATRNRRASEHMLLQNRSRGQGER